MKIANTAETYNVPVAPHGVCTPLGTLAITHVCGVIPNFLVQEFTHYQAVHRAVRAGKAGCRRLPAGA
jgi:L-alanine-DL-glutamate epimerase-like enolase superfamily enzyme